MCDAVSSTLHHSTIEVASNGPEHRSLLLARMDPYHYLFQTTEAQSAFSLNIRSVGVVPLIALYLLFVYRLDALHGLRVNGGCQRCQLAPRSHLAVLTAGDSNEKKIFVMCFRRSVQLLGRVLVEKPYSCHHAAGPSRCGCPAPFHVVAKQPMAHFYNPGYYHKRSPNRSFLRNGAGCRPSTCAWRSSCVGVCLLTQ